MAAQTTPIERDITVVEFQRFAKIYRWRQPDGVTVLDVTGWTAAAQIRAARSEDSEVLLEFDVAWDVPTATLTVSKDAPDTVGLGFRAAYWDLLITPADADLAFRLYKGRASYDPAVTQ